jgi:hypothetical protein
MVGSAPEAWLATPSQHSRSTSHPLGNNTNTFTWSGPSGVLGCTGQRPEGRLRGGACQVPIRSDGCHAVPLKTSAEEIHPMLEAADYWQSEPQGTRARPSESYVKPDRMNPKHQNPETVKAQE